MSDQGIKLTEDQINKAKDAFKSQDKRDQDKILTRDISNAMKLIGTKIDSDWLDKWTDDIDQDATGYIDFDEFCFLLRKKKQEDEDERELKECFRVLDKDKKGEIDVADLRWILRNLSDDLTEEEIDDMIADTDTDGSGFVDYDEFKNLMMAS